VNKPLVQEKMKKAMTDQKNGSTLGALWEHSGSTGEHSGSTGEHSLALGSTLGALWEHSGALESTLGALGIGISRFLKITHDNSQEPSASLKEIITYITFTVPLKDSKSTTRALMRQGGGGRGGRGYGCMYIARETDMCLEPPPGFVTVRVRG